MPDVFISYSSADERIARFMHRHLTEEGVATFLASVSLAPGQAWSDEIQRALSESTHVLFLASRAACRSPWVQQELGFALGAKKQLVPVVWDLDLHELPGWAAKFQPLDLKSLTVEQARARVSEFAGRVKQRKAVGLILALAAAAVIFAQQ